MRTTLRQDAKDYRWKALCTVPTAKESSSILYRLASLVSIRSVAFLENLCTHLGSSCLGDSAAIFKVKLALHDGKFVKACLRSCEDGRLW